MITDETILRIASKIASPALEVKYTTMNSPQQTFKKNGDIVRVYDNPKQSRRFTAVFSGKNWEDGGYKTLVRIDEHGGLGLGTGKEEASLGKPVIWTSLPLDLRNKIIQQLNGKYEE